MRICINFVLFISVVGSNTGPPYLIQKSPTSLVIGFNRSGTALGKPRVFFKRVDQSAFILLNSSFASSGRATIPALAPYTQYQIALASPQDELGARGMGQEVVFRTSCGAPMHAPVIVSALGRNESVIYLSWKTPDSSKFGGAILEYLISYKKLGVVGSEWKQIKVMSGDARSLSKRVDSGNVYEIKMRSRSCAGYSPYSKAVKIAVGSYLEFPDEPEVEILRVSSRYVAFRWGFPLSAASSAILIYECQLGDVNFNKTYLSRNTSSLMMQFSGLKPFTSYSFRVRAINGRLGGGFSLPTPILTLEDAPGPPGNLTSLSTQYNSVELLWRPPQETNGVLRRYEVEVRTDGGMWAEVNRLNYSTSTVVTGLQEHTQYWFRVRGFTVSFGNWSEVVIARTMSRRPLLPPEIIQVDVTFPQSVMITWNPPPISPLVGIITSYKIIFTDDIRQHNRHWKSKEVSGNHRSVTIAHLRTDTVYFFRIAAKSEELGPFSSEHTDRTSRLGLPPPPFNASVNNVTSTSASVQWSIEGGYRITVVKIRFVGGLAASHLHRLVDPNQQTQVVLTRLQPNTHYVIELVANNYVGDSSGNPLLPFHTQPLTRHTEPNGGDFVGGILFKAVVGVLTSLCLGGGLTAAIAYFRCRKIPGKAHCPPSSPNMAEIDSSSTFVRASTFSSLGGGFPSRSGTMLSCQSAYSLHSRAPSTHSTQIFPEQFVLAWADVFMGDVCLGVGNFGHVVKAMVRKDNNMVPSAVKTLKDGASQDDKQDFMAELDLMSRIGEHRNVISLLGACQHEGSMFLCTEFAPNGNLLRFLRKSRKHEDESGSYTTLSQEQLLTFALDVADGMTYLSDKQILHRDLAARNILLGEEFVCKVSDFGLSRREGLYVKNTVSRLPIRWMAIESLNYNVYTTKSDVWSFGILLWEIVSLGGTPYCGMSCAELYDKLPVGYRMEKPINCDNEMYNLMCQCWRDRPYQRPSFPQIALLLERMRDEKSDQSYVNTAMFEDFRFVGIDVTEEDAIKRSTL